MKATPFQRKWIKISEHLGLDIQLDFQVDLGDRTLTLPVLLRGFGAENGMLLTTDYGLISDVAEVVVNRGYGYSCLSEPSPEPIDWESVEEMLSDWGASN